MKATLENCQLLLLNYLIERHLPSRVKEIKGDGNMQHIPSINSQNKTFGTVSGWHTGKYTEVYSSCERICYLVIVGSERRCPVIDETQSTNSCAYLTKE